MKKHLLHSLLALIALCSVIHLPAVEIAVSDIPALVQANGATVSPGTARIMVSARLGSPSAVLPDGSWLYSGYTARVAERELIPNATLVVRFAGNQVARLTLADQTTVTALRQMARRPVGERLLAVR